MREFLTKSKIIKELEQKNHTLSLELNSLYDINYKLAMKVDNIEQRYDDLKKNYTKLNKKYEFLLKDIFNEIMK